MNRFVLLFCLLTFLMFAPFKGEGQIVDSYEKLSFAFPTAKALEMANFNGDSLLDLVLLSDTIPNSLRFYKNVGKDSFAIEKVVAFNRPLQEKLEIVDINHDNIPDIFLLEKQGGPNSLNAHLLFGDSNFTFRSILLPLDFSRVSATLWHDFNKDGSKDLFVSGDSREEGGKKSFILLQEDKNFTVLETNLSDLQITDLVKIAGPEPSFYLFTKNAGDSTRPSGLYTFEDNKFAFTDSELPDFESSLLAQGDLNHDGQWDLFAAGITKEGEEVNGIFFKDENGYEYHYLNLEGKEVEQAEIVDTGADGIADLLLNLSENGESTFYAASEESAFDLSHLPIEGERFYLTDYDHDGKVEWIVNQEERVVVFKNKSAEVNKAPSAPLNLLYIPLKEGLLFTWTQGEDDKTKASSLSYDIMISGKGDSLFQRSTLVDERTGFNKHFGYGALATDLIYEAQRIPADTFELLLSTFDNAHFTGPNSKLSLKGGGSSFISTSSCLELNERDTLFCQPTKVSLNSFFEVEAQYWVSYSNGYLGKGNYEYSLQEPDTLYGITIDHNCMKLLTVRVNVEQSASFAYRLEACQMDSLYLKSEAEANSYFWSNAVGDSLGSEKELSFLAQSSDTIFLSRGTTTNLCPEVDTFFIEVFPLPDLQVSENITIRAGEQIWLQAWGAEQFEWFPKENINDPFSANISVAPKETTTYFVEGTSAFGCIQQDSVQVIVENDLFIPSLFSPNGDGKNDRLEVSGSGIEQLRFEVYGPSGTLVFEAQSLEEARRGWNGTHNGQPLPAGNLAWRIQGRFSDGSPLKVATGSTGFVTLIR